MAVMRARQHKTNVKDVPSSFVGRGADIAGLTARLERTRLVTVIGPGGMGKTRLALRVGDLLERAFSAHDGGGVWFCDCTGVESASALVPAVATVLGVRLSNTADDRALALEVGAAIARRGSVLLILDNFEHLVAPAAATVGVWLRDATEARFLVTSRILLDLPGEELWPLTPLTPDESFELFVSRARQVRPDTNLGGEESAVISEIVDVLDGIPLALELAASRMAVVSPSELRQRLARPLDLLTRQRDVGRHTSMRRTILDSVHLLAPRDRDAFVACAVFRGGFTLEAAEAVLGAPDVMTSVETLVRHSLLRANKVPETGEIRFSFFETIREVAALLYAEHPGRGAIAARHATYYGDMSRALGPLATIHSGGDAFSRIGRELENLKVAHAHAVALAEDAPRLPGARHAIAIALALDPVLSARGLSQLRLRLLDEAILAAERASSEDAELAEAVLARGLARRELGEMDRARSDFETGLSLSTHAGAPGLAALAHARIGEVIEVGGATAPAHARFLESLRLLTQAPDDATRSLREAEVYTRIAHAHRREGRLPLAEQAVLEAVRRYRLLGHDEGLAGALYEAAVVAMFDGRREVALTRFDEGLLAAARANVRAIGAALKTARGGLLQEVGSLDEALAHHAEAARVFHELGSRYREASALYYLATATLERGDAADADKFLVQARARLEGVGSPRYEALVLGCRAVVLACLGDSAASAEALEGAERASTTCTTEPALGATVAIHRLHLAIRTHGPTDPAASRAVDEARALVAVYPSDDSRFALRMLVSAREPAAAKQPLALVIWGEGRFFQAPHASDRHDLSRRSSLVHILNLLARRRVDAPGELVSLEAIVSAGWPGERMDALSAQNRSRVALATLRKLGLRDLLVTGAGGYCVSPAVAVRFVGEEKDAGRPSESEV